MKKIDFIIGFPLAWNLYVCEKLTNLLFYKKKKTPDLNNIRKILILKWFGMGTLVKIAPLLETIRVNFPNTKIIFYTFSRNKDILKILNLCDEIKVIDNISFISFLRDVIKNIFQLKCIRADLVIDLEFCSHFSTIFSFLSGARERIGFDNNYSFYRTLSNRIIHINKYNSLKEIYLEIGKILGLHFNDFVLKRIEIDNFKKQYLEILLQKYGVSSDKFLIGIDVNVSNVLLSRRWPAKYFVSLINILSRNLDYKKWKIVLTGSDSEKNYIIKNILSQVDSKDYIINLAGVLDLECLIALMDRFKIFISNDSGPLYIAVMQGVPTVSFWGPTSPFFQMPVDESIHKYFYTKMDCSFCFDRNMHKLNISCRNNISCLREIKPELVADYILNFIKN